MRLRKSLIQVQFWLIPACLVLFRVVPALRDTALLKVTQLVRGPLPLLSPCANPCLTPSAPKILSYSNSSYCPSTQALNAAPFSVVLGLKDGFGTHVVGAILGDVNYVVTFTSSGEYCSVESPPPGLQAITEGDGGTTFANITLEGKSNSTCTMWFSAGILEDESVSYTSANVSGIDGPHSDPADLSCQVSLGGCDNGQEVKEGESYDTCEDPSIWGGIVVMLLFLGLLTLICVLFIVIVLHQYRYDMPTSLLSHPSPSSSFLTWAPLSQCRERQRLAEEAYYEELEIDDDIMSMTSLEGSAFFSPRDGSMLCISL